MSYRGRVVVFQLLLLLPFICLAIRVGTHSINLDGEGRHCTLTLRLCHCWVCEKAMTHCFTWHIFVRGSALLIDTLSWPMPFKPNKWSCTSEWQYSDWSACHSPLQTPHHQQDTVRHSLYSEQSLWHTTSHNEHSLHIYTLLVAVIVAVTEGRRHALEMPVSPSVLAQYFILAGRMR